MATIPIEVVATKPGLTPLDAGAPKMILHTTEVGTEDGLIARCRARDLTAFAQITNGVLSSWTRGTGYPTQLLVDAPNRRAIQCVPMDRGGYALEDTAGGVRTNRAGTRLIQVEIVGHSRYLAAEEFTDDDWRWLGTLLRQVCNAEGIPFVFPLDFIEYPASYGLNADQRLDPFTYRDLAGVIGHQHVPENAHGDPGTTRVDLLLAGIAEPLPPPPPPDPGTPPPTTDEDLDMADMLYVTNSQPRTTAGREFPPGSIIYAIHPVTGAIRNLKPAEWRALAARGQTATPTPNDELDYQAAP